MATKKKVSASPAATLASSVNATSNLQKIDHIVILMMENRSFDQMLGYLSLVGGRTDVDGLKGGERNTYRRSASSTPIAVPVHHLSSTSMPPGQDPCHTGTCVDQQLLHDNGGFVQNYYDRHPDDPDPGIVMGYYQASDLPTFDFLAREFSISDRWFASVRGSTWPNRLYLTSGKAAGSRDNKTFGFLYRNKSWVRHLDANGVTWKGYGDAAYGHCSIRFTDENYRSQQYYEPFGGSLTGFGFLRDAETGQLPAVSIIDPTFFKDDDHPPADIALGQTFVARANNALAKSPAWNRTLLIVLYDEHGGFFDHVPPGPADDDDPAFRGYGVRVPAFFIGPYVPKGGCFHTGCDHASVVKTILTRFCATNNGAIPDMGARVANAAHLGEVLSEPAPRPAPPMPAVTVKKLTTQVARLAFNEFVSPSPSRETGKDEADLIATIKQLHGGDVRGQKVRRPVARKRTRAVPATTITKKAPSKGRKTERARVPR